MSTLAARVRTTRRTCECRVCPFCRNFQNVRLKMPKGYQEPRCWAGGATLGRDDAQRGLGGETAGRYAVGLEFGEATTQANKDAQRASKPKRKAAAA